MAYLFLGLWCAFQPYETADIVGFNLVGQQGVAEYVAVYGGLEFSIGIICTIMLFQQKMHFPAVVGLTILYGCLVLFRSVAMLIFGFGISNGWYLFSLEVSFFIISLVILSKQMKLKAGVS